MKLGKVTELLPSSLARRTVHVCETGRVGSGVFTLTWGARTGPVNGVDQREHEGRDTGRVPQEETL